MNNEPKHSEREAFELQYASGDYASDAISLARREDGEYEQALARLCFKWFSKGRKAKPFDFVSALREAKAIVQSNVLFNKFIDGTPLHNDIAVWMAEFAGQYSGQASRASKPEGVDRQVLGKALEDGFREFFDISKSGGYYRTLRRQDISKILDIVMASLARPAPQDVGTLLQDEIAIQNIGARCSKAYNHATKEREDIWEAMGKAAIEGVRYELAAQQATGGGDE